MEETSKRRGRQKTKFALTEGDNFEIITPKQEETQESQETQEAQEQTKTVLKTIFMCPNCHYKTGKVSNIIRTCSNCSKSVLFI